MSNHIKEMTIQTAFNEEYPISFYFIPSGFKGRMILVTEDPYEGAICKTISDSEYQKIQQSLIELTNETD